MALGVSTHGGALRISASSYAPSSAVGWILSACLRRRTVMDVPFLLCRGPFVALERQGLCRLQRLSCHCYGTWNSHSMESQSTSLSHCTSTIVRHCMHRANEIASSPSMFGMHGNSSDRMEDNWSKDQWSSESLKLKIKKMQHSVLKSLGTGQISILMKHYDSQCQVNNINGRETVYENDFPVVVSENECVSNNISSNFDSFVVESQLELESSKILSQQLEETQSDNREVEINLVPESCNNITQKERNSSETSVNGLEASKRMASIVRPTEKEPNKEKLACIYDKVLVVDNISTAKEVVRMLTTKYRHCIHACDTEVANIDVNLQTPVGHGEIICFSIYSGEEADFGNGKSCIWVDVLDGGRSLLMEFLPFFEDPSIKKVWHNYSFDSHVLENYGVKLSGFHADTMHLARLWDSSRRADGGYSLEALTSDTKVMSALKSREEDISEVKPFPADELLIGKVSMKSIFGKRKLKKDGSEGKQITLAPLEVLQREERELWICYSSLDSISTKKLFNSLKHHLEKMEWTLDGGKRGTMYDFYEEYWRPFGNLLVKMESEGMLVDRVYLKEMEKVAMDEQQAAANRFRKWAETYCADAKYMNVGSDVQIRQLFFSGTPNRRDHNEFLPEQKTFKVLNSEANIDKEKKAPSKYRKIELKRIVENRLETDMYTDSGWPSVCGDALKVLAGNVSADPDCMEKLSEESHPFTPEDTSIYGTAYNAFGGGKKGREACHAIAALCEICSIDSLISNFLLPLQGSHISCANGRVHCSLNINTETGRLSARRPSLQNQPALEKDRYKIRQAFIAKPGNSLIVADYGQLELRILAHLANCKSMLEAFRAGGDFHSRTAMNMYEHVRQAVEENRVLLEWHPQPGESEPPVPLLKNAFASERRKAKMLNFSIAYGKTVAGLSRDWKVSVKEAKETVDRWYKERKEVRKWQEERKKDAKTKHSVQTLLGRSRHFPSMASAGNSMKAHIERAAINTPVQGSAADVAMCAMLEIDRNAQLKELGWKLLLQVHDEVILEGPTESAELAKAIVVECMSKPFCGTNILRVDLSVDAKCAQSWYAAK